MIRPLILLALASLPLWGCGRSESPAVRQDAAASDDTGAAAAASGASQADDTCPGSPVPHSTRPKTETGDRAQAAASRRSKLASAARGKLAGANAPGTAADPSAKAGGTARPRAGGPDPVQTQSREVEMGDVRLTAPKGWTRERPPMNLILAQFRLPRAQGDSSDAELTVAAAMRTDAKSLKRLREQIKEEAAEGSVESLRIGDHEVIVVDTTVDEDEEEGGDGGGPSKPASPPAKEGRQRVLNAMVFLGSRVYFVNCTGPEKTIGERAGEFRAFLQSMKSVEKPGTSG